MYFIMIPIPFATLDFGDSVDGLKECLGTSKLQNDHKYDYTNYQYLVYHYYGFLKFYLYIPQFHNTMSMTLPCH